MRHTETRKKIRALTSVDRNTSFTGSSQDYDTSSSQRAFSGQQAFHTLSVECSSGIQGHLHQNLEERPDISQSCNFEHGQDFRSIFGATADASISKSRPNFHRQNLYSGPWACQLVSMVVSLLSINVVCFIVASGFLSNYTDTLTLLIFVIGLSFVLITMTLWIILSMARQLVIYQISLRIHKVSSLGKKLLSWLGLAFWSATYSAIFAGAAFGIITLNLFKGMSQFGLSGVFLFHTIM